jgi:hypothetical protein
MNEKRNCLAIDDCRAFAAANASHETIFHRRNAPANSRHLYLRETTSRVLLLHRGFQSLPRKHERGIT